jgi:glycosyltransferase involved in cell wall biosynthesis
VLPRVFWAAHVQRALGCPMKVLMITKSFLPKKGGAQFAVHHLANRFVSFGHHVTVLNSTTNEVQADAIYGVQRYSILAGSTRLGYHRLPGFLVNRHRLARRIAALGPDAVMVHFAWPVGIWVGTIGLDIPFSITCHGPGLNVTPHGPRARYRYRIDPLLAKSMNNASAAVAISGHARSIMLDIGVVPERIVQIPNGVDVRKFSEVSGFNLRAHFGIPDRAKVLLSVGRESYAKAYDVALKAFSMIADRDAYYVILGKGVSKWRPYAEGLGCGARVVTCEGLYGEDLIGAYQQADVFTLPSIKELCPLVVPEAMAAGKPVVVTNVSGSQDMIVHGENGLVVEPGAAAELAGAWASLLEDATLRIRMGEENLRFAPKYDWSNIALRHLECVGVKA